MGDELITKVCVGTMDEMYVDDFAFALRHITRKEKRDKDLDDSGGSGGRTENKNTQD